MLNNKEKIMNELNKFNKDRNWGKSHTSVNLAKSITLEASEILELYQWGTECTDKENLAEEIADVAIYLLLLAQNNDIDIDEAILSKIKKNAIKYPIKK
ncbi:nucleotide pyrophosphohydrolase [Mycoplasma todarodis]|uniref:Nucleotide pyrophosphohydrolase n=1 Tax=Mycoplasma todarodis TaxID=1937191 RepID=A0A4R0XRN8_9MOLU|nr:nucleotide pyrophosphohydrolase [Mycoplasma todarodis]TCG11080.1 nucleotide pyrophosphohydrolase [Mycoplasma todarodis]